MAYYTNIYALQTGKSFKKTSVDEMKTLIALHIAIGCLNKFPRVRMYWEKILGIGLFLDNMTRDRFFQLRTNLHLVNNLDRPADCTDVLYKVRPLLDLVKNRRVTTRGIPQHRRTNDPVYRKYINKAVHKKQANSLGHNSYLWF